MSKNLRALTAIVLSQLLIECMGFFLGIPLSKILVLTVLSSIAEVLMHLVLYLCQPCAGHLHDADAQHCAQKQADRIPSRVPASPPDQQAEDNKNCRRRQQKPHLRQK